MKSASITLTGLEGLPLLTHNERLANKTDEYAKQISALASKRSKSDEDLEEMARLEFLAGMYLTDDGRPGIPAWNVFRSIQNGARLYKLGKQIERGLFPIGAEVAPLTCDGPTAPSARWSKGLFDQRSVKVGTSKVTRTRPSFYNWSVEVAFAIDTETLKIADLEQSLTAAGPMIGIGDYRPRFGRYDATLVVN